MRWATFGFWVRELGKRRYEVGVRIRQCRGRLWGEEMTYDVLDMVWSSERVVSGGRQMPEKEVVCTP